MGPPLKAPLLLASLWGPGFQYSGSLGNDPNYQIWGLFKINLKQILKSRRCFSFTDEAALL